MNLAPRIRTAFVAAMLLAQVALPALHGLAFAGENHQVFATDSGRSIAPAAGGAQSSPSHDPSACPICLASRQGRAGIVRAPLNALAPPLVAIRLVRDRAVASPAAPRLDSASPRAPPIRALAFA